MSELKALDSMSTADVIQDVLLRMIVVGKRRELRPDEFDEIGKMISALSTIRRNVEVRERTK